MQALNNNGLSSCLIVSTYLYTYNEMVSAIQLSAPTPVLFTLPKHI
jgi:hypothetical protein